MKKKFSPTIVIVIIAAVSLILGLILITRRGGSKDSEPVAETNLNQGVWVMGRDKDGNATESWVELTFNKAEKTKRVLIKGQSATAKDDKYFLVVYFEIRNESNRALYLLPVDLIRLVKADGKLFAPSVHQNLVEVRPISTKVTNVGFVVEGKEKEFVLRVGEVGGRKNEVKINF